MKVVITGVTGFLGRYTYDILLKNGNQVIPIGRNPLGIKDEIIIDLIGVSEEELIQRLGKFDVLIHIASVVDFNTFSNNELFEYNVISSLRLAKIVQNVGSRFIYVSTALIHGSKTHLITRSSKENPDTQYALSKWLAEKVAQRCCNNVLILRFCGIFGPKGPEHLRINKTIENAIVNGYSPEIMGNGIGKRNYLYVKDAASAISFAINNNIIGIFNIAGKEVLSFAKMANIICEEFNISNGPRFIESAETNDQLIEPSPEFPAGRTFRAALSDIKLAYEKNSSN